MAKHPALDTLNKLNVCPNDCFVHSGNLLLKTKKEARNSQQMIRKQELCCFIH